MKIMMVPLDERPCNIKFPAMQSKGSVEIIVPNADMLSSKKKSADIKSLWNYIFENINNVEGIVLSIEMAIYGGLLPSRLHNNKLEELMERIEYIKEIKKINPNIILYVSNLIMRTPAYNSAEEEPDYYEDYGENIYNYGRLIDQKNRVGLLEDDEKSLIKLKDETPEEYIDDYIGRREINLMVTKEILKLVEDKTIDYLIIPQDDSAPFGFTAIDQKIIRKELEEKELYFRTQMYPGADESACTLISHMVHGFNKVKPNVFISYSSVDGKNTIPKYEDRPFGESIKAHIIAQNAIITENSLEADYFLMVNIASGKMCESWEQDNRDMSYENRRNLLDFVLQIEKLILADKKVIICDVAFSNGGDIQLLKMLAKKNLLTKIYGYAGWNTACNTLGTALNLAFLQTDEKQRHNNIIYRLIEDACYQSIVRQQAIASILPRYNASYYNFNGCEEQITDDIANMLQKTYDSLFINQFPYVVNIKKVEMPWYRMFEINLVLEIN